MDWGKLRSFHAAAEAGSLTLAGERLGISQSAVSRQIAALEEQLGVSLFQRHARGLVLTDSGHTLYRSTMDMATAALSANTALKDQQETPQGELIVSAPVAFGSVWLVPRLGGFVRRHPDLHLDLRLDDAREYDLLKLEAECAIRLWAADKADLIQRKLGSVFTNLYAAPEYLKAHGVPRTPQDLDNHRIIAYGAGAAIDLSRIDAGKLAITKHPIELRQFAVETRDLWLPQFAEDVPGIESTGMAVRKEEAHSVAANRLGLQYTDVVRHGRLRRFGAAAMALDFRRRTFLAQALVRHAA